MSKKITVYMSSVPGNVFVTKNQSMLESWLQGWKIQYDAIDCAVDEEARKYMTENSKAENKRILPQLFVNGEYLGDFDTLEQLVEYEELKEKLV